MEKIRLGIIGIGNMGSEHCRLILSGQTPEIALTCVADPRQDRRDWAQQTLPAGTGIYADGMSLIRAHACDAVLIATPHELHPPLAEAALRAGLHVLSEKPAGVYTAQLHSVIAAAQETGRTYALMFNQRHLNVHEHHVVISVGAVSQTIHRLNAVPSAIDRQPAHSQQLRGNFGIELIVLYQQHAPPGPPATRFPVARTDIAPRKKSKTCPTPLDSGAKVWYTIFCRRMNRLVHVVCWLSW